MITEETVELDYKPETNTILLGMVVGTAETEHGKLTIIGSGRILRFSIDGHEAHVDVDIRGLATAAVRLIAGESNHAKNL